jgi:hypothetical protein
LVIFPSQPLIGLTANLEKGTLSGRSAAIKKHTAMMSTSSGRRGGSKEVKLANIAETGQTYISVKVLCHVLASK